MPRMRDFVTALNMKQVEALRKWNPADLPRWLDEDFYRKEILPRLLALTVKSIRTATDVSHPYATLVRVNQWSDRLHKITKNPPINYT